MNEDRQTAPAEQRQDDTDKGRRAALQRAAKYAAPAMIALLLSEKAVAATGT